MRTTVDLPDGLVRAAKARAASQGESLKTLFERAVERELGDYSVNSLERRGELPVIRSTGGPVDLTSADLERVLADEEAERYGR